jgi:small-conductance mechanosensitive channel
MLERPIEVGHRIELAGVEGVVHEIRACFTTVVTPDNIAILVPNQRFITDNVTNYVFLGRTVRLRVPVSVAPGSDVRTVQRLLMDAATGPDIEANPKPEVALTGMSSTAIGFELWVWYDDQKFARQDVLSRLYYSVSDALGVNGIKPG